MYYKSCQKPIAVEVINPRDESFALFTGHEVKLSSKLSYLYPQTDKLLCSVGIN